MQLMRLEVHTLVSLLICRANHRFDSNMSTKTIQVLDYEELKDGQMYVHPSVEPLVSNLINY